MQTEPIRTGETPDTQTAERGGDNRPEHDDEAEIRYSLTALGEAALARDPRRGRGDRFRGFGPCPAVA